MYIDIYLFIYLESTYLLIDQLTEIGLHDSWDWQI